MSTLEQRNSGYLVSTKEWDDLLSCWYGASRRRQQGDGALSLLDHSVLNPDWPVDEASIREDVLQLERRLGVGMPASYKHFLQSYRPQPLAARSVVWGEASVGVHAPSQVSRLIDMYPDVVAAAERYAVESPDADYFVYGTKQDDASGRTRYLRDSLVVGKYGDADFELILLYPQVRTRDGEMEAALRFHSGEFRAPSFAELMRQLSVFETTGAEDVPPYSQEVLSKTCAVAMPLQEVWWE